MANVTLYWKDGSKNSVPEFDVSYWESQGWSRTEPTPKDKPTTPTPTPTPTTPTTPTQNRNIYRIGDDIYNADNNQKIGATDWRNNWSGMSDVVEVQAPASNAKAQDGYDPYDEALKYGYTREDLKGDPGFFDYWINKTPEQLKLSLMARNDFDKKNETKKTDNTTAALDKWNADALALGLPQDLIDLGAAAIAAYQGDNFSVDEILKTFNDIKANTIDPYFKELADVAISDFQTNYDQLKTARDLELEAERANYGDDIRQAKSGLEKAGMTFTGKGIEELGADSAYSQKQTPSETTPSQIPFANLSGVFNEGKVHQANRLMSTSSAARYDANQQALGRKAEDMFGTTGAAGLGINYTPGGVNLTGKLESDKQEKLGSTLQDIINNWRSQDRFNK